MSGHTAALTTGREDHPVGSAWRTRRFIALVVCAVVSGCSSPAEPARAPVDPGPVRPAAGGAALVVDPQHLEQPVIIDAIPDGLIIRELEYNLAGTDFV